MQVVHLHYPINLQRVAKNPLVLAMGFFDGVHRGHQAVIQRAKQGADYRKLPLAVLTYDKFPGIVYQSIPGRFHYLTTLERKAELLEQLGVDLVYVMDFTSHLGALRPQEFVDDILLRMHVKVVVAGFDHTYGDHQVATMERLANFAQGRFEVVTVDKFTDDQSSEKISSTRIRQAIDEGLVEKANELLGYHYQTHGIIVHGFARGRTIGFPTANVQWNIDERLPAVGVYAVRFRVNQVWYQGMTSVGYNVTFGDNHEKTIEVFLFDFNDQIYGEKVTVEWVQRLRGEIKFAGVEELVAQLQQDEVDSRQILSN